MITRISVFLAISLWVTCVPAQEFLDQSCISPWASVDAFASLNGVTFTVGRTGYLIGLDVSMVRRSIVDPLGRVTWEIRRTYNGAPYLDSEGLLGMGSFPFVKLPEHTNFYHIEIPGEGLPVKVGDYLVMLLESQTNHYHWWGGPAPCNGISFALNSSTGLLDPVPSLLTLGYQTYVRPDPKPPAPPLIQCPELIVFDCTNSAVATVEATIQDPHANPIEITWTIEGSVIQTNYVAGGNFDSSTIGLTWTFPAGEHLLLVSASNGKTPPSTCVTSVRVGDSTPPQILRLSADPNLLWPPDRRMVPVQITAEATDNCGPVSCRILSVSSSETRPAGAKPRLEQDWEISGLSLNLRAARSGAASDRVYTIVVECDDPSGNRSQRDVTVVVLHDQS